MLKPISLVGEQKKILFLPTTNPIQIKGVAGSGKTSVALYRAKHLIETYTDLFRESNVAIFTFNKSLVNYIKAILPNVAGGYLEDSDRRRPSRSGLNVIVTSFHSWAWRYLRPKGFWLTYQTVKSNQHSFMISNAVNIVRQRYTPVAILSKATEFYAEEISWIKGKMITDEQEYQEIERAGRGTVHRVTREDRRILWEIFIEYCNAMDQAKLVDFDDYALYAYDFIANDAEFDPPFTHMVIDEAQDLSKAQLLVLQKLVKPELNSITIIADAAQQIYKHGFSWQDVNMNVRGGRTKQLKKNYRNTRQIAAAAMSLIDFETDKTEFTELECAVRDGDKPQYAYFDSFHSQMEYVCSILKNYNLVESPTVILHRNRSELNNIAAYLTRHGITTEVIHKDFEDFGNNSVKICTLSSVKGMEFDNVIIVDLNDDIIPFPPGFTDPNDDYHISTERKLLYVAMTRARELLYLFCSGKPSRYLDEIDPETILTLNEFEAEHSEPEYNAVNGNENEDEDENTDVPF